MVSHREYEFMMMQYEGLAGLVGLDMGGLDVDGYLTRRGVEKERPRGGRMGPMNNISVRSGVRGLARASAAFWRWMLNQESSTLWMLHGPPT
jgi:hypothetical protein